MDLNFPNGAVSYPTSQIMQGVPVSLASKQSVEGISSHTSNSTLDAAGLPGVSVMNKPDVLLTVSEEATKKAIEKINKILAGPSTQLEYSIHHPTNTIVVKVINKETNQVIREIPPEKLLDINDKLLQLVGMFIDEKR